VSSKTDSLRHPFRNPFSFPRDALNAKDVPAADSAANEENVMGYTHPLHNHPDAGRLRKEAGRYLKRQRQAAGLTQQEVARRVGIAYYTTISQVEAGKTRVPPDKMQSWAEALQVEPTAFAQQLLRYYDPFTWQLLFGNQAKGEVRRRG
jgi:DNA-binding XRE family transcriptional regulator